MNGDITLGRGQTYPLDNYKKGARVWIRDPELVWIGAELLCDVTFATKMISVELENGEVRDIKVINAESLPFLRNPDILLGRDDLTTLSYLHEPAVLNNLAHRFMQRECIYTYCGIVLVAINPYANCSQMYSDEVIQVYRGAGNQVRELDPHVYAVAEEAFFDLSEYEKNQSIIVSGESGAGKTVSAKFVMRYFASVAGTPRKRRKSAFSKDSHEESGIERRVLASNPIMEAIGNAKTIRNDNSSRFGKFIQINFTDQLSIAGAQMKTYLLEKSRVVFQACNERNYHIFYQMCASRSHPLLRDLNLGDCESYFYTSQGGDSEIIGVDDGKDFLETVAAFDLLGVAQDVQQAIFRTFAGILLLGNIEFECPEGDDELVAVKQSNDGAISQLCKKLYEIDESELRLWLSTREIRAAGEIVRKPLNRVAAVTSRDALAKMLYGSMFAWIVKRVNGALLRQTADPRAKNAPKFIGVLDIYGFETFEVNSFEQFCINYANEKLQQQFCQHVFKLEQSEYEREEISWVRIDFYDNQPCIDLIEGKFGLIDYLDEQCKMGRGTDLDWLETLQNSSKMKKSEHFQLPRIKNPSFIIRHFAADVVYLVDGFLEKNKDTVSEQLVNVVKNSKMKFLHDVLLGGQQETKNIRSTIKSLVGGTKKATKKCVSFQFRDSLNELMTVLGATRPHYVRCIKPNDEKLSFTFEPKRAIQQLRACGVLETVRISAAGYPSRWSYEDFGRRYRVLYPDGKALWRNNPKQFAGKACHRHIEEGMFALGKTKVFFRTGQVALLERLRQETLSVSAVVIQKIWKGFVARRRYQLIRQSILTVQAATRAYLIYTRMKYLQMHRAVICIQTAYRRYIAHKKYLMMRAAVIMIQSHFRGALIRRKVEKLRYEQKAIVIQKYFRGWLVRREQLERTHKIIRVQCLVRRWLAKRRLKELKIEARSVGHLQKLNKGLENKIISLQQRLDIMSAENSRLIEVCHKNEKMRSQLAILESERPTLASAKARVDELELEVERLETECDVRDAQIGELETRIQQTHTKMEQKDAEAEQKLQSMRDELMALSNKYDDLMKQKKALQSELAVESEKRISAEQEISQMRDQLLANANLLASPALSRIGSMRASQRNLSEPHSASHLSLTGSDGQSVSLGAASGDLEQVALILKQQQMINDLRMKLEQHQRENDRLKAIMDANSMIESLDKRTSMRAFEVQRVQELELAYSKLKMELDRLIEEKAGSGFEGMNFRSLFEKTLEENDRRREESAELRAILASRFERHSLNILSPLPDSGHWSLAHSDDDASLSDLDEELCLERQCRQLKAHIETLTRAITERNQEIEQLENRLNESLPLTKPAGDENRSVEETITNIHRQLNHLVSENLSLQSKLNRQADELTEARAQLRGYSGALGFSLDNASDSEIIRLEALTKESVEHSSLLEVFNVPEFTRILVCDLKPRLARLLTPCLPAYLLLAAFRYYDHAKDEAALTGLFSAVHVVLKDTVSRSNDMDVLALWLVNSWRLFNLLRQYSGENNNEWYVSNTEKQNSQRMQSFDLAPIRDQLCARVEECFQNLMKRAIEPLLAPKIVPGILQHDTSQDLMINGNAESNPKRTSSKDQHSSQRALDDLLELLNFIHTKLKVYGADAVLLSQVFGQMTYWICALALNHLMFRKELCNFEKAIQIKHNVTEIQSWLSSKGFGVHRETLEPLVQASHLLQSKKDESNLDTLCGEMTSKLKPKQVIAILQHYAPSDGFEERHLEPEFLIKVSERLNERMRASGGNDTDQNTLIMMGTYLKPFDSRPFVHSDFPLETLSLPTCLHLQSVCRLL